MKNVLLGAFLVLALLQASGSFADVSDGGSGVIASGSTRTLYIAPNVGSSIATSYSITGETTHAQLVVRILKYNRRLLAKARFRGAADQQSGVILPALHNRNGFLVEYTCRGRQPGGTCEGMAGLNFQ